MSLIGSSVEQVLEGWEVQIIPGDPVEIVYLGPYDNAELAVYWAAREMAKGLGLEDFDQAIEDALGPFVDLRRRRTP